MRLPWKHKNTAAQPPPQNSTLGTAARRYATDRLEETQAQWPDVREVASSLRKLREENHFAANIRSIFQGGQPE